MNFLTFIVTLLIILALICHSIQSDSIATNRLKISYAGYMRASRDALNTMEKRMYKKARKKPTTLVEKIEPLFAETEKSQEVKKPKKDQLSPLCTHLNLADLIGKKIQHESVRYQLFVQMLRIFYGNNLLAKYPKNFEQKMANVILESIQRQIKELPKNTYLHLAKLQLNDPSLQPLFYRMLKGTKDRRYPSILDYVDFAPQAKQRKICLACATKELLTVLFHKEFAQELWQEKDDELEMLDLNANKLQYLLQKHGLLSNNAPFLPLLKYHHGPSTSKSVTIEHRDEITGISVKRQMYYGQKNI